MNSLILSIDGNIGSGKSTLYNKLKLHYKDRNDICFVPEPVEDWHDIIDDKGTPILTNLYQNTKKYAFRFQMMAYISRLNLLRKAIQKKYKIIITERCVQTDKNVFAKMLYDDGNIEHDEYQIYNKWFYEFLDEINIAGIIYVKADPEVCDKRVKIRAREGETIPLEYLQKCHKYHEDWLCNEKKRMVIDANIDITNNIDAERAWLSTIDKWIHEDIISQAKPSKYLLQFDGACRGNPSNKLGLGCILYENGKILDERSQQIQVISGTNNQAEYLSLLSGLKMCINNNIKNVLVQGDSELIINQINGIYNVNNKQLSTYYNIVIKQIAEFDKITFQHIKRDKNKAADKLANEALDSNENIISSI
uniref:RNase H type-1 domain-containing protein n=1 Tax=viral metagenome TaxID=1070528 RepID=A0A6C0CIS7_9ZZZZ